MTTVTARASDGITRPASGSTEKRNQRRRLYPRFWDIDWLVLRGMHSVIAALAERHARHGMMALDFGCGDRPYEPIFRSRGMAYIGADFGVGADIAIAADGHMTALDNSCDMVLSFQVLEHVRDLDTYFAEAARVLRPDGTMILSTHGTWLYHPHPEDHRRWTRMGLLGDIERRGFEVLECTAVVGPLAWTTMVRLTCAAVALRKIPLVGHGLAAALAVVMNARAWLEDLVTPDWVTNDNACVYVTVSRPKPVTA